MKQSVYNGSVGLSSAYKKAHQSIGTAASLTNQIGRTTGIFILAIAHCLLKIGLNQSLHHLRMRSLHIV